MPGTHDDAKYLALIQGALEVCKTYKPMFGMGRKGGMSLAEFQRMYGADPFYSWMGLDSPLMYAAHKAAGGMTSVYRQLGMGTQWIVNQVIQDTLSISQEDAGWSYDVPKANGDGGERTLTLDGRIPLAKIRDPVVKARVTDWTNEVKSRVRLDAEVSSRIRGTVFEIRQGYKSKDSKRQNADISNASNAYAHSYVPILLLLSSQIDTDLALRYRQARWLILTGTLGGSTTDSTYAFCKDVLGYDLADFFKRNSPVIKAELEQVLQVLLAADE